MGSHLNLPCSALGGPVLAWIRHSFLVICIIIALFSHYLHFELARMLSYLNLPGLAKWSQITWNSKGPPLAKWIKFMEFQWNSKGCPLQIQVKSKEIRWNFKGHPLQNESSSRKFDEIPRGPPLQIGVKSIEIRRNFKGHPLQNEWNPKPRAVRLGGPSYQASVLLSLDVVMCCAAVCHHKYMDA